MSNAQIETRLAAILIVIAFALTGSGVLFAEIAERPPTPRNKPQVTQPSAPAADAGNLLTIVPRKTWQAKPALPGMKPHVPLAILVHHTAGPVNAKRDVAYKMRSLQAYSQKPAKLGNGRKRAAWPDVPYHFYISADGAVAEGRDVRFSGDTNTNYDPTGHIQVVMEGNFENTRPTPGQLTSLETLLVDLATEWKVAATEIRTHKQVASTLCPGRNFMDLFPELKQRVADRLN